MGIIIMGNLNEVIPVKYLVECLANRKHLVILVFIGIIIIINLIV